mmetsp:Transcript_11827/g.24042  ORF Transcript_11827/g.24042 Transcript_11827/m.24042 type:complete len:81 (+) Transcript_11827:2-244(+)
MRLEPLVLELEGSTTPVLIIAQEAPCRLLRTYLLSTKPAEMAARRFTDATFNPSPHPQLVEFTPMVPSGFTEVVHEMRSL